MLSTTWYYIYINPVLYMYGTSGNDQLSNGCITLHGDSGGAMASLQLQPPSPFNFKEPDTWPKWKRRFEQFRLASGLDEASGEKQVGTLLYCMGEDAEETLTSTNISAESRKEYGEVVKQFDDFFRVRKNVIFEHARFHQRTQLPGESAEQFITVLYDLADSCDYGGLKEEMIRDRIVVGIRNKALSERLQLDAKLTLESAKTSVRQREAVHEQQQLLKGLPPNQAMTIDSVQPKPLSASRWSRGKPPLNGGYNSEGRRCSRCGRGPHPRQSSPARDAECFKCKRKGHFGSVCLSKAAVSEVTKEDPLTAVVADESRSSWNTTVTVNGREISFKLDTGAEVTVISDGALKALGESELQSSKKRLCGPDSNPLHVLGELSATPWSTKTDHAFIQCMSSRSCSRIFSVYLPFDPSTCLRKSTQSVHQLLTTTRGSLQVWAPFQGAIKSSLTPMLIRLPFSPPAMFPYH